MVLEKERAVESADLLKQQLKEQRTQIKDLLKRLHPDADHVLTQHKSEITTLKVPLSRLASNLLDINKKGGFIDEEIDWPHDAPAPKKLTFPAIDKDGKLITTTLSFNNNSPSAIFRALQKYSGDPQRFVRTILDRVKARDEAKIAAEQATHEKKTALGPELTASEHGATLRETLRKVQENFRNEQDALKLAAVEAELERLWKMRIIHLPQWEQDPSRYKKVPTQELASLIDALDAGIRDSGFQWLIDIADPDKTRIDISSTTYFANMLPPSINVLTRNEHFTVGVQAGTRLTRDQATEIFLEIEARIRNAMNPGDFAFLKIRSIQRQLQNYRVRCAHEFESYANQEPLKAQKFLEHVERFVTSPVFLKANFDALWIAVPEPLKGIHNVFSASYNRRAEIRDHVLYCDPSATFVDMLKALGR